MAKLRLASHMRLFEGLFVAVDVFTRVPFSFLCYYSLKIIIKSILKIKHFVIYIELKKINIKFF